jgi:hypothetical protein
MVFSLDYKLFVSQLKLNTIANRQLRQRHWQTPVALPEPSILILFAKSLDVGFAVWIEKFLAVFLPRCFQLLVQVL